jgi:hypothetical protein
MSIPDLSLVLDFASEGLRGARQDLADLRSRGAEEDDRIRSLERALGSNVTDAVGDQSSIRSSQGIDLVLEAQERLGASTPRSLDELLGHEEAADLRLSAADYRPQRIRLDVYDIAIAAVAGLTAGAIDVGVVRVPKTMTYGGDLQRGSPLTAWLRAHSAPADNWLARVARVPFDSMNHDQPDLRLAPATHRADTFGHDPLVGLVLGTLDILRETTTGVHRTGEMFVRDIAAPQTSNPAVALVLELTHLLSDIGTKAGLPLPGWSLLRLVNVGSIDGQTVGELSRQMYLRGFNMTHLATMSTSVAAGEIVLRLGWQVRSSFDADWADRCAAEQSAAGTHHTGNHPRFLAMRLISDAVATAVNAGKVAISGGNPLAWNAAQWASLVRSTYRWWDAKERHLSDAIASRSDRNSLSFLDGWP